MFPTLVWRRFGHGPGVAFLKYIPELKQAYYADKGSNILKVPARFPWELFVSHTYYGALFAGRLDRGGRFLKGIGGFKDGVIIS